MPHISIVTSLYHAAPYVQAFYDRSCATLESITDDYEFIFVDDGCPAGSGDAVRALIATDPKVKLIVLSRNFGQHKALMAGLDHAAGDYVFMLDSDLEEDPELLSEFYEALQQEPELDVIYGYMAARKGKVFERWSGALFYRLINVMADLEIPPNMLMARLMKQGYVRDLVTYQESHVFLGGVFQLVGYNQRGVPCKKSNKGSTTYTLRRKLTLAMDALLSFTNKPLTYVAGLGLSVSMLSLILAGILAIRLAIFDSTIEGWSLVLVSVWLLCGLIILSIGLVGFYVGRVFLQVKARPNTIVKQIVTQESLRSES
jgi:putative glycosyltransferase